MTEPITGRTRPRTGRSPSYPGIPLDVAIERARTVYRQERRNPAPVRVIVGHWGYTNPTSGAASVTYAALRKFGLVDEEGTGQGRVARLTDLAYEIIHNPDPREAIWTAAMNPPIHQEFWSAYGNDLPSDDSLRWMLIQRGFTERGANEFIEEYKATLAFAGEGVGDTVQGEHMLRADRDGSHDTRQQEQAHQRNDHRDGGQREERQEERREPRGGGGRSGNVLTIPVPIVGGSPITVEGEFPVSEAGWTQFIAVLQAMKPGLVAEPADAPRPADQD
jgi:hypothetical protein